MSLDQSHLPCFTLLIFIIWFHIGRLKNVLSCIIARIRGYVYKLLGINSAIVLHLYGYDEKSKIVIIYFFKFIMLTDNQIFRNCFVNIYCHLTKVLSQINKCIIFEPNELSITLSTLWLHTPSCVSRTLHCSPVFHYHQVSAARCTVRQSPITTRCKPHAALFASVPLPPGVSRTLRRSPLPHYHQMSASRSSHPIFSA